MRSRTARKKAGGAGRLVEIAVSEVGARGDGVGLLDGRRVFVPHTLPGERVLARLEAPRGDGVAAGLVEVLEPSPRRRDAVCDHFGTCGGCALQHMDPGDYGAWKRGLMRGALQRRGLTDVPLAPLVRVPVGTRRRAAFSFLRRRDGLVLGFNARASHRIVDLRECPLLEPPIVAALPRLRQGLAEVVQPQAAGDVVVAATETGLDVLIEAGEAPDLFARERLAALAADLDLARLSWRTRAEPLPEPLARRRPPLVSFAGVPVEPPPGAFLQPSRQGEEAIAALVVEAVAGRRCVVDLYAGCGSFTFPMARAGCAVHAVEGDAAPVDALRAAAAEQAGALQVTAELRDLARRPLLPAELKGFDAAVFDPPRAGAAEQAAQLAEGGPPLVVGVSCQPSTLARDARLLVDAGYRLTSVTPIDQFPFSPHLEAVAVFRRDG